MIKLFLMSLLLFGGNGSDSVCQTHFTEIKAIAQSMGWVVTSTTGGKHNKNSKHPLGKAVDLSVRGKSEFHVMVLKEVMENLGYGVLDERKRPKGRIWSGPHLHVYVKTCK